MELVVGGELSKDELATAAVVSRSIERAGSARDLQELKRVLLVLAAEVWDDVPDCGRGNEDGVVDLIVEFLRKRLDCHTNGIGTGTSAGQD